MTADERAVLARPPSKPTRPATPAWDDPLAVAPMPRPKRWDQPFGADMTEARVEEVLKRPEFAAINGSVLPASAPLEGIIANDTRVIEVGPGEIVLREGDYGHSAFLVLSGQLRVVLKPSLSTEALGRGDRRRSWLRLFAGLLPAKPMPEAREHRSAHHAPADWEGMAEGRSRLDVAETIAQHRTAILEDGDLFGELAALTRLPRRASIFAEKPSVLLEIRWQGLRELRRYDSGWRERVDRQYKQNALSAHLKSCRFFADMPETVLAKIVEVASFETYGSLDWHHARRRAKQQGNEGDETPICAEGDYADGLLLIGTGFARVWARHGSSKRTLTYLSAGDVFGLHELHRDWSRTAESDRGEFEPVALETGLSAIGYVDVIRIPAHVLEKHLFPCIDLEEPPLSALAERPLLDDSLLQWAGEEHFINGTKTMLIDLTRCVRCDDCVRACAATHGGNPRFIRSGPVHDQWMVAHACMHCVDPVCMVDCPTGAIHRERDSGAVTINPETCIGCATCAEACPYGNIRMVELCEEDGRSIVDEVTRASISRATKCDLCVDNFGGPACVRACPQDALKRVDFAHLPREGATPW
ncbi:MAG: cyclic nucleotide-binding domain-containing protein [Geminicoccaceae bacterium]